MRILAAIFILCLLCLVVSRNRLTKKLRLAEADGLKATANELRDKIQSIESLLYLFRGYPKDYHRDLSQKERGQRVGLKIILFVLMGIGVIALFNLLYVIVIEGEWLAILPCLVAFVYLAHVARWGIREGLLDTHLLNRLQRGR